MGFTYLNEDSGTWGDDTVVEMMKKSQREYNKRFLNKKQESTKKDEYYGELGVLTPYEFQNISKEENIKQPRCSKCQRTMSNCLGICTECSPSMKGLYELEQENSNLKEELKQRTNNRDHYKQLYEEAEKLAENRLKDINLCTQKIIQLEKEYWYLKDSNKTLRELTDKLQKDDPSYLRSSLYQTGYHINYYKGRCEELEKENEQIKDKLKSIFKED